MFLLRDRETPRHVPGRGVCAGGPVGRAYTEGRLPGGRCLGEVSGRSGCPEVHGRFGRTSCFLPTSPQQDRCPEGITRFRSTVTASTMRSAFRRSVSSGSALLGDGLPCVPWPTHSRCGSPRDGSSLAWDRSHGQGVI